MDCLSLQADMEDPNGKLIPGGVRETFTAEIVDEVVRWRFKNRFTTIRFALLFEQLEKEKYGHKRTAYFEKELVGMTLWPGMKKEEILEKLKEELRSMGGRIR